MYKRRKSTRLVALLSAGLLLTIAPAPCQQESNAPESLGTFRDLALGMFVHWSVDVQLGSVISHSLVGASDDYKKRYFEE